MSLAKNTLTVKACPTTLSTKECRFCHIESASDDLMKQIGNKGYHIIEMENC